VGVASIVRFGHDYTVVPDAVIENLRQRADPDTGLHCLGRQTPFEPESMVRIVAGAFDGLEGVFQRDSGNERVVVLLTILGCSTPVRIPAEFVLPQSASQAISTITRRAQHAYR
jgi:transcription antitermination factor NusG